LPRSWTYGYDASGRLSTVSDPLGVTTYGYDASGRLNSIMDALNKQAKVTYDASGRVAAVQSARSVAAAGPSQTFTYGSGTANVVSPKANAMTPVGPATTYTLGSSGEMLSTTNPLGNRTSATYDASFNVLTATDALNKVTRFTYDTAGNVLTQTDPLNHTMSYTYDTSNEVLTMTDQRNKTTTYTYDTHRNQLSETDPIGDTATNTYDAYGRKATEVDPRGNLTGANAATYTTTYAYDSVTSLVSSVIVGPIAAPLQQTTNTYDVVGDQLSQADPLTPPETATYDKTGDALTQTDGAGDKESFSYDMVGQETGNVNAQGNVSGNNPASYTTSTTYYADGLQNTSTDPLQRPVSSSYDWDGNQTSTTDARNNTTNSTYDLADQLISTQDATTLATTTYSYDADGQTTSVTNPKGTTLSTYDDAGRLIATQGPRFAADGVTPLKTTYTYDAAGRHLTMTSPAGNISGASAGSYTTTYNYDDAGRLISVNDPAGNVSAYVYDAAGNRISLTGPTGTTTTYAYDALDREIQSNTPGSQALQAAGSVNASGTPSWSGGFALSQTGMIAAAVSWPTSSADLKLELLNASGSVIATATNVSAGPESLTYANAPSASYSLRVTAVSGSSSFTLDYSIPVTEVRTTIYDVAGRATSTTDAKGTTQTTYDNADRPNTVTLPGGSTQSFTYFADGVPSTQTDSTGTQGFTYDTARELKTATDQSTITSTYGYDGSGNQASVLRSSGPGASSATWDQDSRLQTKTTTGTASFNYADTVNRTDIVQASGDVDHRNFDQGGLVTEAKTMPSQTGPPIVDLKYSYDAQDNLSTIQDLIAGKTPGTYTYDVLDRLASEVLLVPGLQQALTLTYAYDAQGNRAQVVSRSSGPSVTTSFTYNPAGQLMRSTPPSGAATTYVYDQAGNLTRTIGPAGTTAYTWNPQELLSQVTLPSGSTASFTYDANGTRRTQTVGSATTTYNYDDQHLVSETGPGGTISYTYDDTGAPLTITLPSGVTYTYRFDGRGSTIDLTDASHLVAASYTYDAWGNVLAQSGDATLLSSNPYTYRGQFGVRTEAATGLYFMQARYYDPAVGRFISRDPTNADPSRSAYIYAADNPVTDLDPSGSYAVADGGGGSSYTPPSAYQLCVMFTGERWLCRYWLANSHGAGHKSSSQKRCGVSFTTDGRKRLCGFVKRFPTKNSNVHVTSSFWRKYKPNGSPYSRHLNGQPVHGGTDIGGYTGEPLLATCNGTAYPHFDSYWGQGTPSGTSSWRGWDAHTGSRSSYGLSVAIHCDKSSGGVMYAHLSHVDVRYKQHVSVGNKIGRMGMTGSASGPHLHFEIHPERWSDFYDIGDPYPALIAQQ
jgi:RHS repeat-associated protein